MTWMFSSLLLRDADEVQYRFGCMYRGVAQRVGAYFDALENAYAPAVDIGSFGYAWNAKAGLEFVHGQIARNLVERIVRGGNSSTASCFLPSPSCRRSMESPLPRCRKRTARSTS